MVRNKEELLRRTLRRGRRRYRHQEKTALEDARRGLRAQSRSRKEKSLQQPPHRSQQIVALLFAYSLTRSLATISFFLSFFPLAPFLSLLLVHSTPVSTWLGLTLYLLLSLSRQFAASFLDLVSGSRTSRARRVTAARSSL